MNEPVCPEHRRPYAWVEPDPQSSTSFDPHWECGDCLHEFNEAVDAGADWLAAHAVLEHRLTQALAEVRA